MTIHAAILTVSDSAVAGTRADTSGPALAALAADLGWSVAATALVPDEESAIAAKLREWSDAGYAVILTTGGTGSHAQRARPRNSRHR
jgi:molybdenum cofactor biosynthesis protein B